MRFIDVFDEIISQLLSEELPSFFLDGQTIVLEDYFKIHPEKKELVSNLIKNKKLLIGPFYCLIDEFSSNAENYIRNILIGMKQSKEFGDNSKDFIAYLVDTFGHSQSVPQYLQQFKIDKALLWRGAGNLPTSFYWNNIKTIQLHQGYFIDTLHSNLAIEKKAEIIQQILDNIYSECSLNDILLPIGGDHLSIPDNPTSQIKSINSYLKKYEIEIGNIFEYFKNFTSEKYYTGELRDCSKNFILSGCHSSRIYQKTKNTVIQWNLQRILEPLNSIFYTLGYSKSYCNEIEDIYKTLLKNEAHDSICGCSNDFVHKEVDIRFGKINNSINFLTNKHSFLQPSPNLNNLMVINLSNFKINHPIRIVTEQKLHKNYSTQLLSSKKDFPPYLFFTPKRVPINEDKTSIYEYLVKTPTLEPFSITKIDKTITKSNLNVSDNSISNKNISLKVKDKMINIYKDNKVFKNVLSITNRADIGDSYNFGALKNDTPIKATLKKSKKILAGNLKSTLRLIFELNIPINSSKKGRYKKASKHTLYLDVSLYDESEYLEFNLYFKNKSRNHILQIEFNSLENITSTISEEGLGTITRNFDCNYNIYNELDKLKKQELKTNTAPMQRFVKANEFGIVTKGLQEYEIEKNKLKITVLRATETISQVKNPTRGIAAGPDIKTQDLQMLGENNIEFSLAIQPKINDLYRFTEDFFIPLIPIFNQDLKNQTFLNFDNEKILVYAIKEVEKGILLRLFNNSNEKQNLKIENSLNLSKTFTSNGLEEKLEEVNELIFNPNELLSIILSN